MKTLLSAILFSCTVSWASEVTMLTIHSQAIDTSDPNHVAKQIFDAMKTKETTSGSPIKRTVKTNGRITCTKSVDESLSDTFAWWNCDLHRKAAPTGVPEFSILADNDAVEITASPDYFKDIDTDKIKGADCKTEAVPGRLATPPHDKTTCRFELN